MTELKSCPLYSGDSIGIIPADIILGTQYWRIHCYGCGCTQTPVSNKEDAIENWNKCANPWHTGKPTEEGRFYAVICKGWERPYNRLAFVKDGKIYCLDDAGDCEDFPHEIVKYREVWQFKGNQEKSEEISSNSEASNWTVKELMEKLKVVPEDAQVCICSEDCGWEYPATGFGINYSGDRTEVVIY